MLGGRDTRAQAELGEDSAKVGHPLTKGDSEVCSRTGFFPDLIFN